MPVVVYLILFLFTSACTTIPDIKACSVAGRLANGMDCAHSLQDKTYELTLDETIKFLEPSVEEDRGGAICLSSEDYVALKTALEQACYLLSSRCVKAKIPEAFSRIEKLRSKSMSYVR